LFLLRRKKKYTKRNLSLFFDEKTISIIQNDRKKSQILNSFYSSLSLQKQNEFKMLSFFFLQDKT